MIGDTLKAEQAYFVIYSQERGTISAGTEGYRKLALQDMRDLEKEQGVVITGGGRLSPHAHRIMVSNRLAVAMPLRRDETVIGYLCLGEHRTSSFTRRDIRVLKTIADELVIAIQNALSVQQVRDLNAHLEQRIDSATRELRTSNAQLQRLDEAKDEFISMASHQLRTPLTSIKGYISMLSEGDVGPVTKEQKHLLDEAFVSSERMVRLISDFLNVSRLQTGKFVIEKQPVDLAKIVAQEIEALGTNAAARGLSFSYVQPKKFPTLNVDEAKIRQVIMNFADNAIYYSKENTKIRIELKAGAKDVEFTVKDTGIGVPDSEKDHLFSKFFRATNARKQRPDGTGVGLFLAKKVIDAHDGAIVFESTEGKGSTFGFRLPIAKLRVRSDTK
jgi:signal transduction histidine kinase